MRVLLSCARIRVVGMNVRSPDDKKGNKRRRPKTSRRVTVSFRRNLKAGLLAKPAPVE
jgi:hypothetical protein